MSPRSLFRGLARAEAVTWGLLLAGMFLKYVTRTTEVGVQVFGMAHGVVFIGYCLAAVLVGLDQRWPVRRIALALACAVPPFLTLWLEARVERRDQVGTSWTSRRDDASLLRRAVAWLVGHPVQGAVAGIVAVAALTGVALVLGPPTS